MISPKSQQIEPPRNSFLCSLPDEDYERLQPHLTATRLVQGNILHHAGEEITEAYFPHGSVVALGIALSDGEMVAVGTIGHDGVVGAFGGPAAESLNVALVQIGGPATSIRLGALRAAARRSDALRDMLHRHDRFMLAQAQQSAACIARHVVEQRLCSGLLRSRDLARSAALPLTQEFLAELLGVRRTSIALATRRLHDAGLIDHRRGEIRIVDAEGLGKTACECYEATKRQTASLLISP